jgi:Coenzyme PQQ synthesis protein D (PqqD)
MVAFTFVSASQSCKEKTMVTSSSRFAINTSEVTGQVIDGEAIIMNLATGMFYSIDNVGASIWTWIEQGFSVGEITAQITAHFDVSEDRARSDLEDLAGQLIAENLVEVRDEPGARATSDRSDTPHRTRCPYHPPELNRYSDMTDMLALDPPMPVLGAPWDNEGGKQV